MSYVSKVYNPGDKLYASDLNNIITGIDELKNNTTNETPVDEYRNLLDLTNLNHKLRYSPGNGTIVSSSSTVYSLFVCELEANTDYELSYGIGGFGLFTSEPKNGSVAVYQQTNGANGPFKFNTGDCTWIAINISMNETNTADTIENTPKSVWDGETLKKCKVQSSDSEEIIDDGTFVRKDELFTTELFNMVNPADFRFDIRYSTGSTKMVAESSLLVGVTGLIEVVEDEWYTVSGDGLYGSTYQGGYFTADAALQANQAAIENISFTVPVTGSGLCFQVPTGKNIKYVAINIKSNNDRTAINGKIQMELGEMSTTYVEYAPKEVIKAELLPSNIGVSGGSSSSADDFTRVYNLYTSFDSLHYYGIDKKISKFKEHWLKKDKNLCVVNTGTSLTARSSEHCSLKNDATSRPPLMHSNNFASHIWDALKWEGQKYRRFDYSDSTNGSFFTETGTFTSATKLDEWDDGAYRYGLTRYSDDASSTIAFTVPSDAWQFNFIYRTDSYGSENCVLTIAEGNGVMVVLNENDEWVEANGYTFSQLEPEVATIDTFNYIDPASLTEKTITNYQVKGNTTYQKRLYMKAVTRTAEKNITISHTSGRLLYWGVEWSPREFMVTYINAARGSHSSAISTAATAVNHYQDNEIWTFKPDLFITEDPIHNAGAAGKPNAIAHKTYFGTITDNFFFADNKISMRARCLELGLEEPEWVIFNSSIAYNFGGMDTTTGELLFTQLKDDLIWCAIDSMNSCYEYINSKYEESESPSVAYINATKGWVKAAYAMFGDLATATVGSGKTGTTFTNEGSHWNDTGSKVMARLVLPVLDFTT